ncbi:hypothetical protein F5H01DRAFT_415233 [Linnemannia elongata]|nr:hypothetical protein F5H01DRAFT_415233 [Linnemannia elongata]
MTVRRIILSAALLCILPLPFSSPIIDSTSTNLVLGAPPLHLLSPHVSTSSSSVSHHHKLTSSDKQDRATTAAVRRSLKKRTTGASSTTRNNNVRLLYNPPAPPEDMDGFKKCFHTCIAHTREMFPECKGAVPSGPPNEDTDMTWHTLCPVASYVCLHSCKMSNIDWSKWMGAVDKSLVQSGSAVAKASSRHQ